MSATDQVFVLRFWQEPGVTKASDVWRAKVSSVNRRTRLYADGVDAAFAAIRSSLAEAKGCTEPADEK
jgi:hypothetical protein